MDAVWVQQRRVLGGDDQQFWSWRQQECVVEGAQRMVELCSHTVQ